MKKIEVLTEIYLNPGIHLREIARKTNLGIPAVKNHLDKLLAERVVNKKMEGRNVKFFVNFKNRRVIPYLSEAEMARIGKLPGFISSAIADFLLLLEKKPVLTIIFGSYAKGNYTKESDLDVLFVFNEIEREIEAKTRLISSRYSIKIRPVYLTWKEFRARFFDAKDVFMREVKERSIIFNGMEYWVMLENEKA